MIKYPKKSFNQSKIYTNKDILFSLSFLNLQLGFTTQFMKQLEVRHHNAITTARYEYTDLRLDIFFYLVSQLRKDSPDRIYEIVLKDLSNLTGKEYHYLYLREATEQMGSRMFEVETDQSLKQMWMFDRVEYMKGTGRIQIEFTKSIQPYLFELKDNFTSFQLYSALRLSSKYAKRIYAICSQWKDIGKTKKILIHELKRMLYIVDNKGNEKFKQIGEFKRFVLDEAVKQINDRTDLQIGYQLEKQGRSFNSIVFQVQAQPLAVSPQITATNFLTDPTPSGINDQQAKNARLVLEKLNVKDAHIINQIMTTVELIKQVNKFAYELQSGKIKADKNPAGLLLTILGLKTKKEF